MSSLRLALKQSLQETATTGGSVTTAAASAGGLSRPAENDDDGDGYSSEENEYEFDGGGAGGAGGDGSANKKASSSTKTESQRGRTTPTHHPTKGGRSHSASSAASSSSKKSKQHQSSGTTSHRDHSAANTIQAKWKHKQSQQQEKQGKAGGGKAGATGAESASLVVSSTAAHQHRNQHQHSPKPHPASASSSLELDSTHSAGASTAASHAPANAAAAGAASGTSENPTAVAAAATKKKKRKNKTVPPPSPALVQFLSSMTPKQCRRHVAPGLRVKVRFATSVRNKDGKSVTKKKWFGGRVSAVSNLGSKIRIRYDDGTSEVTRFPDQDVIVDDTDNGEHAAPYDPFVPPQEYGNEQDEDDNDMDEHGEIEGENADDGPDGDNDAGGRPSSNHPVAEEDGHPQKASSANLPDGVVENSASATTGSAKRKRGRPPKHPHPRDDEAGTAAVEAKASAVTDAAIGAATEPAAKAVEDPTDLSVSPRMPSAASPTPETAVLPDLSSSSRPTSPNEGPTSTMDPRDASGTSTNDATAMDLDVDAAESPMPVESEDNRQPSDSSPAHAGSIPTEEATKADVLSYSSEINNEAPSTHKNEASVEDDGVIRHDPSGIVERIESERGTDGADNSENDSNAASSRPAVAKAPSFTIRISAAKAIKAVASEEDLKPSGSPTEASTAVADGQIGEPSSHEAEARRADDSGTSGDAASSSRPRLDDSDSRIARSSPTDEMKAQNVTNAVSSEAKATSAASSVNEDSNVGSAAQPKEKLISKRLHITIPKASLRDEGNQAASLGVATAPDGGMSHPLEDIPAASKSPRPKKNKRKHPKEDGANQADGASVKRKKLEEDPTLPSCKSPVPRKRVLEVDAAADDIPFVNDPDQVGDGATTPHARNSKDLSIIRSFRRAAHKANERISSRPDASASDVPKKKKRKVQEGDEEPLAEPDAPATITSAGTGLEQGDAQVQCDACGKWRIIPAIVVPTLPQQWYCSDNVWDPKRASCDALEQSEKQAAKERKRRKRLQQRLAAAQAAEEEGEALAAASASIHSVDATAIPREVSAMRAGSDQDGVDEKSLTSTSNHPPSKPAKREESVSMASNASDDAISAADKKRGRGRPRRTAVPSVPVPKESAPSAAPVASQPGQGHAGDDGDNLEWVQCDSCSKWRKLPPHVSADDLPEVWYCSLNTWNPASASCDAPEDKADGLQDVGFHSGSGAGKLSYRNLIFGNTGRKANRPLSERARAAESLFLAPNDDEDAPPAVMYANSSCFVSRGKAVAPDETTSSSVLDLMSRSNLWSELWGFQNSFREEDENRWMYYTYDTLPGNSQEAAKDLILSVMGDDLISSEEILRRAKASSATVRTYFTINVVVTGLFALLKLGLVDCVQKMGPDFTVLDWDPRYRRTAKARASISACNSAANVATATATSSSNGSSNGSNANAAAKASLVPMSSSSSTTSGAASAAAHKSSRFIKIAKPWKQRSS